MIRPMFWPMQAKLARKARMYVAYRLQVGDCALSRVALNAAMNKALGVCNP